MTRAGRHPAGVAASLAYTKKGSAMFVGTTADTDDRQKVNDGGSGHSKSKSHPSNLFLADGPFDRNFLY